MIFTSIRFLYFFTGVFVLFYVIPHRFRWMVLLAGSAWFYATLRLEYLAYLYAPIVIIYFISIRISGMGPGRKRNALMAAGIFSALIMLFTFKYLDLIIQSLYTVLKIPGFVPLNLILPIGISFYTFKLLSYLIDVYTNRISPERHFGIFALYVSFFPQLLAGPIDRAANFIPQLKLRVTFDINRILSGINLFIWGFFKKTVVSNRLALFADQVFASPSEQSGLNLLFGLYFYSFQIYCDFSGYSDMAIGITRILGYRSMENFNLPYFSRTMTQFWNRWHISLSTWLRDYLFLPVSYFILKKVRTERLAGVRTEAAAYAGGITITMFLGGLWHGASWTFVIWGLLHGIYLSFSHLTRKIRKKIRKWTGIRKVPLLYHALSILTTFHLVTFSWVFFRSPSFGSAMDYLSRIGFDQSSSGSFHICFTLIFVILLVVIEIFIYNREKLTFLHRIPAELKMAAYVLFIVFIVMFSIDSSNEFIYFQF